MRTIWLVFNVVFWTTVIGGTGLILSIFEWRGKILGKFGRIWSKILLWTAGIKYTVIGLENVDPNKEYIFAGNHESAFDILLVFAGIRHHLVSISKIELKWIPIMGWAMQAAKHIFVDRKNHTKALRSLKNAAISLNTNPRSVFLFPEGTRSKDGKIHPFKKGGLLLGIEAKLPIVPMALCGTGAVALKGEWKLKSNRIELRIGKPIETDKLDYKDRNELAENVYKEVVRLKSESDI